MQNTLNYILKFEANSIEMINIVNSLINIKKDRNEIWVETFY